MGNLKLKLRTKKQQLWLSVLSHFEVSFNHFQASVYLSVKWGLIIVPTCKIDENLNMCISSGMMEMC